MPLYFAACVGPRVSTYPAAISLTNLGVALGGVSRCMFHYIVPSPPHTIIMFVLATCLDEHEHWCYCLGHVYSHVYSFIEGLLQVCVAVLFIKDLGPLLVLHTLGFMAT